MSNFAVIDVETNWDDEVISIGVVISSEDNMEIIKTQYYVLNPEYKKPAMFSDELMLDFIKNIIIDSREHVIKYIKEFLMTYGVQKIFAYNAHFDKRHLPELNEFIWYDIMKLAAYKQYNKKITAYHECCSTGRLKCGYGVAQILRMLTNDSDYEETHNAYFDALDELDIMKLLEHDIHKYDIAIIN